MTAAERLRDFYDDDPTKWAKGSYENSTGGRCLVGAICAVASPQEAEQLWRRIRDHLPAGRGLVEWNDAPERTFEDIKALVAKVAS